jgi:hypothetical protein
VVHPEPGHLLLQLVGRVARARSGVSGFGAQLIELALQLAAQFRGFLGALAVANGEALVGNLALDLRHGLLADAQGVDVLLHLGRHGLG